MSLIESVNAAALPTLLSLCTEWLRGGKKVGHEFIVGNLRGDAGESLSINLNTGVWSDFASHDGGRDPVSLFAAINNLSQGEAARQLGARLGVDNSRQIIPNNIPHSSEPDEQKEQWIPFAAPPDDAPPPTRLLNRYDQHWAYHDPAGKPVRYIARRNNPDGGKLILQISYGTRVSKYTDWKYVTGWHLKASKTPRELYALHLMAQRPDATVLVVEGEKACDAAQALFPAHVCTTWSGGAKVVKYSDWSALDGRDVIIWPDADEPGLAAAAEIVETIRFTARSVALVRVDDLPTGHDAADITPDDPQRWLDDRLSDAIPDEPPPLDAPPQRDSDSEPEQRGERVVPLGHDRGVYFYYSTSAGQVVPIAASQHTRYALRGLASEAHYWRHRYADGKGEFDHHKAADDIMTRCRAVGTYDPDRVRGRGAWIDRGATVLHLGNRLIVEGKSYKLSEFESAFIYEQAMPLIDQFGAFLPDQEAEKLLDICRDVQFETPISSDVLAGFLVIAPICGALEWRPTLWITGSSKAGKGWIINSIMRPVLGRILFVVQSKTTEAGIRQSLGSDARPVLFDEAEGEGESDKTRMQGVLDLVRQSTSEGGAEIVKGTQNQIGARRYRIRSCFAFTAINANIKHEADANRIAVLELKSFIENSGSAAHAARVNSLLTKEYAAALLTRTTALVPIIRANARLFRNALVERFKDSRLGDQFGILLAGAEALKHQRELTQDEATRIVTSKMWDQTAGHKNQSNEERCLATLLEHRLTIQPIGGQTRTVTVHTLLRDYAHPDVVSGTQEEQQAARSLRVPREIAHHELGQIGLRYTRQPRAPKGQPAPSGVNISISHTWVTNVYAKTEWSSSWQRALRRLPGVMHDHRLTQRIGPGDKNGRIVIWVPLEFELNDDPIDNDSDP